MERSLATGHPLIDHQTSITVYLMNELDRSLAQGASEEALWVRLLRLHELTREHFRVVKRLMQEQGFRRWRLIALNTLKFCSMANA